MAFLLIFAVACYAHAFTMTKRILAILTNGHAATRDGRWDAAIIFVHMVSALSGVAAFFIGLGLLELDRTHMGTNWSVPLFCFFGATTAGLYGWKLYRSGKRASGAAEPRSLRFGMTVWATLAGLYLTGATFDHWWFFRDPKVAGIAAAQALGADDVPCPGMVFVHMEHDVAQYRCPTSIVWGDLLSNWPFAPWPSYTQGSSAKLKAKIDEAQYQASDNHPGG